MPEFDSSVILIPGVTGGIGYATLRNLLAVGAGVVVPGPTPAGVRLAAQRLVATGLDSSRLDVEAVDFSRLDELPENDRGVNPR